MLTSTNTSLKVRIVLLTEQAINLWLSAPTSKSCLYLSRLYSSLVVLSIDQTPLRLQNQSSGRLMTGCRGSGRIRSFHLLYTLFKSSNTPFCKLRKRCLAPQGRLVILKANSLKSCSFCHLLGLFSPCQSEPLMHGPSMYQKLADYVLLEQPNSS